MPKRRRPFKRPLGERSYKKLFFIASEGSVTEPTYFSIFKQSNLIEVRCIKSKNSSPTHVLNRMKKHLREEGLKKSDEAWLVVDRDQWTTRQLKQLYEWSKKSNNYGLAVSNPKFEYWLLLHFEDGCDIQSANDCSKRLCKYIPHYKKTFSTRLINENKIKDAIDRARSRDTPPCVDFPKNNATTVYRLVEKLLPTTN